MPELQFYAVRRDTEEILNFTLANLRCQIFETYSERNRQLRSFSTVDEVAAVHDLGNDPYGRGEHVLLSLWAPSTRGEVKIERIELVDREGGFRFEVSGWGLFQLQFGGIHERTITNSRFAHNSEARARTWSETYEERLGPVDGWDWDELSRVSRKFHYHLRKRMAVRTAGEKIVRPVLRHAEALVSREGYALAL
ncbi:MAG: hypothetical protein ABR583_03555 [Gaiellaceae bacterium]